MSRYMADMNPEYHIIIQSKTTGRLLIREVNGTWGFTPKLPGEDHSMLMRIHEKITKMFGREDEDDDYTLVSIDYSGDDRHFFLIQIDGEHAFPSGYQWCHLFQFPENFDDSLEGLFENSWFQENLLNG